MRTPGLPARLPQNHRLVLRVVQELEPGTHASAADLFARAKARKASLGYSTVYRALRRLCGLGLVLELHVPGLGTALYEPARSTHAHFVCARCGWIEDVDCVVPTESIQDLVAARGGSVDDVVVTVSGLCVRCRSETHPGGSGQKPHPNA